jgi:pimeloyl-ACP methyl ester carboxylesterase
LRLATAKPARNRAEAMNGAVRIFRHIRSRGYPFDEAWVRDKAGIAWDRDPSPYGMPRQLAAIFASGDRTAELGQIDVPTLVIHGDRDRMVHPTGGGATARAIPGARLETIAGMGHDLPRGAWNRLLDLIAEHVRSTPSARARETS